MRSSPARRKSPSPCHGATVPARKSQCRPASCPSTNERRHDMRYHLKQIHCRPWTLNGLSLKLIESHYENNYGGGLRGLNAITQQLESLDFAKTPGHVLNGLKRGGVVGLNPTPLPQLYFPSLRGDGPPTKGMFGALARAF